MVLEKNLLYRALTGLTITLLLSCGHDSGPVPDTSAVGDWYGFMIPIHLSGIMEFNGAKIFVDISKTDSLFSLVTLDTTRDTTKNPSIKDTSLVLTGAWKLNATQDSILLICDTGRIIDTTLDSLSPREVKGRIIPMAINISDNPSSGDVEWEVPLTEMVPLAPLLGMDLSGVNSSILDAVIIVMIKVKQ